jgi:glycosyltransferase involved in cell wall biosynthesis
VIAVSDDLAGRIGAPNLVAIPRGADMDVFAEEVVSAERTVKQAERWGLSEDTRPIILAPGRLDASNGYDLLIDAVGVLQETRPELDFVCLIVGAGEAAYAAKLEAAIVEAGLAGRVRLVGDTDDMAAALKISAVIVSAATEPPAAGRTMIEAQAMGRPVIAPDHGAMSDVVAHGETGWLTPPGDAVSLAGAMAAALSMDQSQRAHIGMAGRARVRARFTLETMLGGILGVYEDVTGRSFRAF